MVPMLTCGFVRSNLAFATWIPVLSGWFAGSSVPGCVGLVGCRSLLAGRLGDDFLRHVLRHLGVAVELHRVARAALRLRAQVTDVAEHLRQRHERLDDAGTAALLHGLD